MQYLVSSFASSSGPDLAKVAMAYRSLVEIEESRSSRNQTLPIYNELHDRISATGAKGWPNDELEWFAATAWNNGVYYFRLQNLSFAEKWLSRSRALLTFCPTLSNNYKDKCENLYNTCLQKLLGT
ncbi:unnamed protein product [Vitrella brassicaformis CCMP3155]|uniref:Uncharacterized protein n=1 Tax=Vitrella brassicaformis (strain CCMP3155) TaxID=1169540 RepID=A0A0G4EPY3_VITBC|nr:unnamed protein product [Vitrella brassicaformis CCMP3155]|eukprot:CEL99915.1 unnamed protein product [Vitrella brassicaformis CCMP3155]